MYKNLIDLVAEELEISSDDVMSNKEFEKVIVAAEKWADQLGEFVFKNKESFTNSEDAVDAFYNQCDW